MPSKKKKPEAKELAALTPDSVAVKIDGREILVPTNKYENAFLNMLLASRMRMKMFEALRHWEDKDEVPTPKELADLAKAARDIASFSAEIYASELVPSTRPDSQDANPVDFNSIKEMPPKPEKAIEIESNESSEADDKRPATPIPGADSTGS